MYHDLITEKSWKILQELKRKHKFVLIGGWAVFLYTHQLKSKDIDIIVAYEDLEKIRAHHDLSKNDRLKKYEIHQDGIDVDIYVPYFSDLGVPTETIAQHTTVVEGFHLPTKELLCILKQKAWQDRGHSIKGEKDKIDIIGLMANGINWPAYKKLTTQYDLTSYPTALSTLLASTTELPELNLNAHAFARLKKSVLAALQN